ncbi:hypothetical protein AAKU52_000673 [Pedobacter sp. CG_S7]|uniref:hypothetical protein n=1 Tax=Pedobacter sp. CG_S7 TaxID=3143930 RepID=UPI00339501AA
MKTYFKLYSFLFFAAFLFNSCRNPAYELNVLFDADVIEYKATLILKDASGSVLPNNLTVAIAGADAASIYDFSGTKKVYANGGVITLGVTPKAIPTAAKSLSFNVLISGPGYDDKNIPVTIVVKQFSQIIEVTMLKVAIPTAVTAVAASTTTIVSGTTVAPTVVATPTGNVGETATVTVPAGTQMKDATGAVIAGSKLIVNVVNYEAKDPATIDLFPGASLSAPSVVGATGTTGSAFFIPAGFTSVKMFVDSKEVRNFNTPINISVQLDPTFRPSATGAVVKVGDQLPVYSYDVSTGQFKFEVMGTAAIDSKSKLAITFPINHLTIFVVGDVFATTACIKAPVTYIAPWLNDAKQPVIVEVLTADGLKVIGSTTVLVENGLVNRFANLPAIAVRYRVKDYTGNVLAQGAITNPCAGAALTINLTAPAVQVQNITLVLNVVCPGKGSIIVPNFDLFYKPTGAANTEFRLLGTAEKGLIKTTLLKVGVTYDFRGSWKNETKVINKRTITAQDMSITVGEDFDLGTARETNRALLIELCKTID